MLKTIATISLLVSSVSFAEDVVITQKDKKFSATQGGRAPASVNAIKIKAGDSLTFKNEETDVTHNVYSLGPKNSFEIQVQEPGKSSTVQFKEKGTTEVECAIHPGMKIKVEVE
jgi:plastocyanin